MRPGQGLRQLSTCPVNGVRQRPYVEVKMRRGDLLYLPMGFGKWREKRLRERHVINSFVGMKEVALTDAVLTGPYEGVSDTRGREGSGGVGGRHHLDLRVWGGGRGEGKGRLRYKS